MITAHKFRKALDTNSTNAAFTAKTPTTTEPTGDAVLNLLSDDLAVHLGLNVPTWLLLLPYGTNGNNDTFDMRVWGWNPTADATPVYIPQILLDVSVILGDIAATAIAADTFLADTFTLNDGAADLDGAFEQSPWVSVLSPAEDLAGTIQLHTRGCQYIEFDFDLAGGQEGVSMNCLWRPVEF